MKTITSIAVICLGVLATGCATDRNAYGKTVVPAQTDKVVVNGRYVGAVEKVARERGTQVVWINQPTTRVAPGDADE